VQLIQGLEAIEYPQKGSVVTIGNFDGFHLGHRQLVQKTVQEGRILGLKSIVLTFFPHPMQVLKSQETFFRLFDEEDQVHVLTDLGIEALVIQPFTIDFSKLSPQVFIRDYLIKYLNPKILVLGYDFQFGSDRSGDLHLLEKICAEHNISLVIIPPQKQNDEKISSSQVREWVLRGEVDKVQEILLRPFYLKGIVISGETRGQKELVRTANLKTKTKTKTFPKKGVYISQVLWKGQSYPSVTNVGFNPTFESSNGKDAILKIETHLLDVSLDLYDQEIKVEFLKFIREEQKFESSQKLKEQILKDISIARSYFEKKI